MEELFSSLDRGWRLIATGVSFLLFGLGGLAMALAIFPFLNIGFHAHDLRQRIAQRVVQRTWRLYIRIMRALGVLTYDANLTVLRPPVTT